MAKSPFKMAGFSGFGNSPLKQDKDFTFIKTKRSEKIREGIKNWSTDKISKMIKRNLPAYSKRFSGQDISKPDKLIEPVHFQKHPIAKHVGLATDSVRAGLLHTKLKLEKESKN
jgi:hypothetical protein